VKVGTAIYRCILRCTEGNSDKTYIVSIHRLANSECTVYFEHGPSNRVNQGGIKASEVSEARARTVARALVSEKRLKKGYVVVSEQDFQAAPTPARAATPGPARKRMPSKIRFDDLVKEMSPERQRLLGRFF